MDHEKWTMNHEPPATVVVVVVGWCPHRQRTTGNGMGWFGTLTSAGDEARSRMTFLKPRLRLFNLLYGQLV